MFHTAAYFASIANDGDLHQLAGVQDSILSESGLGLLSNQLAYLMGIGYVGTSLTRGQFQAPSIRDYGNLDTDPINIGTLWESPPRFDDFSRKMIPLAIAEEWDTFAAQDNAMASEDEYAFLWVSDGNIDPIPPKKIVQIFWSSTPTLVANTWSLTQMVMAQPLYPGKYAIVGARVKSAGALSFRFVPSGGPTARTARPGGVAVQADDQLDHYLQRRGGWGKWLDFDSFQPPQVEILSISADTSVEGIIDIVPY